jgi:uncharacterized protein
VDQTDPADLEPLASFLASDRAPEGCMDLSELDGFLAGLIAGPERLPPGVWLPIVWDNLEPEFADPVEEARVMNALAARFAEAAAGLDTEPPDYTPVFWQDIAGNTIVEDWAAGFMQAVSLCADAWRPVFADGDVVSLLIPIAAIAGLAIPVEDAAELPLPEALLKRFLDDAESVLPTCVAGLRRFWRSRGVPRAVWSDDKIIRH